MRQQQFYKNRLQKHFNEYFSAYEETAEFYVDPAPNKWKFYIPELRTVVLLTCKEDGTVIEERVFTK